jgi:DNA-binding winged helix-turn-helix (wHTH) protein
MRQLRKKLEEKPSRPGYLLTEPWVGYRFNATLQRDGEQVAIEYGNDPSNTEALWKKSEEIVGEVF